MPLRVFPVAGGAQYTNDWGFPRSGGRTHEGNDLFGEEGTPLLAVDDGRLTFGSDGFGGNVAAVRAPDGTRYYYAHLSGYEGTAPREVSAGEVIGYLGRTGNAVHTQPHLHFQMHPGGGSPVNPYSSLTRASIHDEGASGSSRSMLGLLFLAGLVGVGVWAATRPVAPAPEGEVA